MAPGLVIIADDLTGAADSGAASVDAGLSTAIPLTKSPLPPLDVLAINTNTRDLDQDELTDRMTAAVTLAIANGYPGRWYKKIDSALRGHPGRELDLLMAAAGFDRVVLCPALPSQERTTTEGQVLVRGVPLHHTVLGADRTTASISSILAEASTQPIHLIPHVVVLRGPEAVAAAIREVGAGIIIVDAGSESDLDTIIAAIGADDDILLAGSAGLATALVRSGTIPSLAPPAPPVMSRHGPILVVSGTRHAATARQIDVAVDHGFARVRPKSITRWSESEIKRLVDETSEAISSGADTILTVTGCDSAEIPGHAIAAQLATIVNSESILENVSGLILTGGDNALAVCDALAVDCLWLRGEVLPAVPWATLGGGRLDGLPVITKAGSFGGDTALTESADFLHTLCSESQT